MVIMFTEFMVPTGAVWRQLGTVLRREYHISAGYNAGSLKDNTWANIVKSFMSSRLIL